MKTYTGRKKSRHIKSMRRLRKEKTFHLRSCVRKTYIEDWGRPIGPAFWFWGYTINTPAPHPPRGGERWMHKNSKR